MARADLEVMGIKDRSFYGKTREWKESPEKLCVNGVNPAPSAGGFPALPWELGAVSQAKRRT